MEEVKEKRIEYLDLLRIISTITVIVLHISTQYIEKVCVGSFESNVFIIYNGICRWCVPVFVMISGTLLLSKEYSFKKLYFNKILRIIIAFIFWSIIYVIIVGKSNNIHVILRNLIEGYYHMWFLYMIVGLYIMTPVLKKIAESEKLTKYFIIIWVLIITVLPLLFNFILLICNNTYVITIVNSIKSNLSNLYISLSYTGYFILGYYLNKKDLTKVKRKIIYFLGLISAIITIILTIIASKKLGVYTESFCEFLSFNVLLESVAIFIFAKYHFNSNIIFRYIAECCFGIYLVHLLILDEINTIFKINSLSFNPIISVLILTVVLFFISLSISTLLRKIPIVNKYIA